jgi:hypothetical protein
VEAELERLATIEQDLDLAIERWAELESQAEELGSSAD